MFLDVIVICYTFLCCFELICRVISFCFFFVGDERIYLSSDSIDPSDTNSKDDSVFSPEFLNSIKVSGLPNHALRLRTCYDIKEHRSFRRFM